jgi:hypothetical protein
MIDVVIGRQLAHLLLAIDRGLARIGRRCCVVRSERRLDRAKLPAGG